MAHSATSHTLARLSDSNRLPAIAKVAVRFAALVTEWDRRARTRKALVLLEDWQLEDIGKTYEEARRESSKYFWQL